MDQSKTVQNDGENQLPTNGHGSNALENEDQQYTSSKNVNTHTRKVTRKVVWPTLAPEITEEEASNIPLQVD